VIALINIEMTDSNFIEKKDNMQPISCILN
jgi:hypothetical protein